jgi:hypothetical protein
LDLISIAHEAMVMNHKANHPSLNTYSFGVSSIARRKCTKSWEKEMAK